MRIETVAVPDALGTILMHNIADERGGLAVKKGVRLSEVHLAQLATAGRTEVEVAILEASDVHEDEAAAALAGVLQTEHLAPSRPAGGRANLRAVVDGVLEVDAGRLLDLNMVPGIGVGTRRPQTVAGPNQQSDSVATVKIIPFALARAVLDHALELAQQRPGILELRPFQQGRRAVMLLVGEPSVHDDLAAGYVPATLARLERLAGRLETVERVVQAEGPIRQAAGRLIEQADLLLIAGQTSIMDENDTTLRSLRAAGAEGILSGAPVEPGNMLALAYLRGKPVLCLPACAKGPKRNVVDLVLPRLLLGDRLERRDIAALGLGGFLSAGERGGAA
jgi:molybdenum cofactor cytidylyltransferase